MEEEEKCDLGNAPEFHKYMMDKEELDYRTENKKFRQKLASIEEQRGVFVPRDVLFVNACSN